MIDEKDLENWKSGMIDEPISWPEVVETLSAALKVVRYAGVGLTLPCDRKTRPCDVCSLREALAPFEEKEKG